MKENPMAPYREALERGVYRRGVTVSAGRDAYQVGSRSWAGYPERPLQAEPVKPAMLAQARIERNRAAVRLAIRRWTLAWALVATLVLPLQADHSAVNMAFATFACALLGAGLTFVAWAVREILKGVLW